MSEVNLSLSLCKAESEIRVPILSTEDGQASEAALEAVEVMGVVMMRFFTPELLLWWRFSLFLLALGLVVTEADVAIRFVLSDVTGVADISARAGRSCKGARAGSLRGISSSGSK